MTKEVQRVSVESNTGYRLLLFQTGNYWRSETVTPEGTLIHVASLQPSAEQALASVELFFDVSGNRHTGVTLRAAAEAELKFSNEP